jgi:phosphoribosylpyrophosphate synthetase
VVVPGAAQDRGDVALERRHQQVACARVHRVDREGGADRAAEALAAVDRLKNSAVTEIVVTNTLPLTDEQRFDKLTCLSIAPLLSQAIREVFEDGSVTKMFDGHA